MAGSPDKGENAEGRPFRKRWSAPEVIVSESSLKTNKLDGGVGYEYHETDHLGGGTTNVS